MARSLAQGALSRREALGLLAASAAALLLPSRPAMAATGSGVIALAAGRTDASLYKVAGRTLSRSTDGGRSSRALQAPVPSGARPRSISLSAGDPAVIYLAGPGLGVLRSADGGTTWRSISRGLPGSATAVAAHARQADTVYAYVPGRGIFRSEDAGRRWRLMDAGPRGGITQFVHSDMPGSMQTGWLFVAGPNGVRLSMDCFCGWRQGGDLGAPAQAIAYDPRHPARVLAAAGTGVFESTDGGQAWTALSGPAGPVAALAISAGGELYAGSAGRVYRRSADGWEALDA